MLEEIKTRKTYKLIVCYISIKIASGIVHAVLIYLSYRYMAKYVHVYIFKHQYRVKKGRKSMKTDGVSHNTVVLCI